MTGPLLLSDMSHISQTHAAVTTCGFNCMLPMTAYLQARKLRRGRTQSIQSSCVVTLTHANCSCIVRLCCAVVTGNDICSVISSMGAADSVHDVCVMYIVCYVAGHVQQKLFIAMCRLLIKTCLQCAAVRPFVILLAIVFHTHSSNKEQVLYQNTLLNVSCICTITKLGHVIACQGHLHYCAMRTKHLHMQTCQKYRAHLQIQFSKLFPGLSVQHIYVYIPSQKLNRPAKVAFTLFQSNLNSATDVFTNMQMTCMHCIISSPHSFTTCAGHKHAFEQSGICNIHIIRQHVSKFSARAQHCNP